MACSGLPPPPRRPCVGVCAAAGCRGSLSPAARHARESPPRFAAVASACTPPPPVGGRVGGGAAGVEEPPPRRRRCIGVCSTAQRQEAAAAPEAQRGALAAVDESCVESQENSASLAACRRHTCRCSHGRGAHSRAHTRPSLSLPPCPRRSPSRRRHPVGYAPGFTHPHPLPRSADAEASAGCAAARCPPRPAAAVLGAGEGPFGGEERA